MPTKYDLEQNVNFNTSNVKVYRNVANYIRVRTNSFQYI